MAAPTSARPSLLMCGRGSLCPELRRPGCARGNSPLCTIGDMAVKVEMQNTGDPPTGGEIAAVIEHMLSDRPGEWRVSIVGSHANDNWEMKVE